VQARNFKRGAKISPHSLMAKSGDILSGNKATGLVFLPSIPEVAEKHFLWI